MQRWRAAYLREGYSSRKSAELLAYVESLVRRDLPPIVNLHHLSLLVGVDYDHIIKVVNAPEAFYRQFDIPKHSGGTRTITAPYPSLAYIQRWILDNILRRQKAHGCVHGFVPKRSIVTNASAHCGCAMLLKMDIADFFGSIPQRNVVNYFRKELGYNQKVSVYLSQICCLGGALPQGAPTSPALSNLISMSLDRRLYRLAKHFGLNYTRYADDVAFSGNIIPSTFIKYVTGIADHCGLQINHKKTRLYGEGGRKIIAGVSLATGTPRLPREYRRQLRAELHYIERFGLKKHMLHSKIRRYNYGEVLLGRLSYWLSVEPDNAYALRMKKIIAFEVSNGLTEKQL